MAQVPASFDDSNAARYHPVIKTFADRDTEQLFKRDPARRFPAELHRAMRKRLMLLNAAASLAELRIPPGNRLEKLMRDRRGQHSIRVNDRWRVCFRWHEGDAYDVELADYH